MGKKSKGTKKHKKWIKSCEHVEDAGWCLMLLQSLKRKYRKFAEDGVWPDAHY
jgi:hypothetical protein